MGFSAHSGSCTAPNEAISRARARNAERRDYLFQNGEGHRGVIKLTSTMFPSPSYTTVTVWHAVAGPASFVQILSKLPFSLSLYCLALSLKEIQLQNDQGCANKSSTDVLHSSTYDACLNRQVLHLEQGTPMDSDDGHAAYQMQIKLLKWLIVNKTFETTAINFCLAMLPHSQHLHPWYEKMYFSSK